MENTLVVLLSRDGIKSSLVQGQINFRNACFEKLYCADGMIDKQLISGFNEVLHKNFNWPEFSDNSDCFTLKYFSKTTSIFKIF